MFAGPQAAPQPPALPAVYAAGYLQDASLVGGRLHGCSSGRTLRGILVRPRKWPLGFGHSFSGFTRSAYSSTT